MLNRYVFKKIPWLTRQGSSDVQPLNFTKSFFLGSVQITVTEREIREKSNKRTRKWRENIKHFRFSTYNLILHYVSYQMPPKKKKKKGKICFSSSIIFIFLLCFVEGSTHDKWTQFSSPAQPTHNIAILLSSYQQVMSWLSSLQLHRDSHLQG